jgi:hypothetical protein
VGVAGCTRGERVEQGLELVDGVGCELCARSHFFIVCWNLSTLPQVVGWLGREFFCTMFRRRSSCSRWLRPPGRLANRTV